MSSIHFLFLIQGWVVGQQHSKAKMPRPFSPQPLRPTPADQTRGVPKPAKTRRPSACSMFSLGSPQGKASPEHLPREVFRRKYEPDAKASSLRSTFSRREVAIVQASSKLPPHPMSGMTIFWQRARFAMVKMVVGQPISQHSKNYCNNTNELFNEYLIVIKHFFFF